MAIYRLTDDFEEDDVFTLIAVHSSVEDYRMAYLFNRYLKTRFVKSDPVEIDEDGIFQKFEWVDSKTEFRWYLIQNGMSKAKVQENNFLLFNNLSNEEKVYLLPEYKKVDFFVKIEAPEEFLDLNNIVQSVQQIPNIVTTYKIAANQIKTRTNLIF
ncbi:hypothetical protein NBRC110019_21370 [Neptunitalea chrysea]|uniref:IPExxxVDY family protein n=1 Tax=Neptunitalea chrysea TaxID=1647581 RepID=A0A9W6B802_9FLAO|nr:IPExxxVDY family protein [Neptunitalea chrysea]GLB53097.1 hypothetical protein NBRC110019_21370 [Neptunitalea chrysea]